MQIKEVDTLAEKQTARIPVLLFAILLAAFLFYSRLQHRAPYLYSWDSVSFALSIERFDMRLHQPHPPGYFLYSYSVKALNAFVQDANLTMIILNIAATLGACWFIFRLVHLLTNRVAAAAAAAALYAVNPVTWFYGSVAEVYAIEGFWVALIAYLVLASRKQPKQLFWASAAMAGAGGFRPTTEVFLFPFFATAWLHRRYAHTLASIGILILGNLLWVWPLSQSVGGMGNYVAALQEQSRRAAEVTAELPAERMSWAKIAVRIVQTATPALLLFLLLRFRRVRWSWRMASLLLIIIPALLVFGLLHFPKDGYLLLIIPALITIIVVLFARTGCPDRRLIAVAGIACAMSLAGYLWPLPLNSPVAEFTRPNVEVLKTRMDRLTTFFQIVEGLGGGRPKTFVLENRHFFPNWRMLLYYYPEDTVYLIWPNKKRAYVAAHREYRTVPAPLNIDSRSILVAVGRSSPTFESQSFQVDAFRFYFAESWNLPHRFQVYSMPVVIADEE